MAKNLIDDITSDLKAYSSQLKQGQSLTKEQLTDANEINFVLDELSEYLKIHSPLDAKSVNMINFSINKIVEDFEDIKSGTIDDDSLKFVIGATSSLSKLQLAMGDSLQRMNANNHAGTNFSTGPRAEVSMLGVGVGLGTFAVGTVAGIAVGLAEIAKERFFTGKDVSGHQAGVGGYKLSDEKEGTLSEPSQSFFSFQEKKSEMLFLDRAANASSSLIMAENLGQDNDLGGGALASRAVKCLKGDVEQLSESSNDLTEESKLKFKAISERLMKEFSDSSFDDSVDGSMKKAISEALEKIRAIFSRLLGKDKGVDFDTSD